MSKLDSIDSLLEKEVEIAQVGTPKKSKKGLGLMIKAGIVLAGALSVWAVVHHAATPHQYSLAEAQQIDAHPQRVEIKHPELAKAWFGVMNKVNNVTNSVVNSGPVEKITGSLIDDTVKNRIGEAASFSLPKEIKDGEATKKIVQYQLDKGNYDYALMAGIEQVTNHVYNDVGKPTGGAGSSYGRQSSSLDQALASSVTNDKHYVAMVTSYAGKNWDILTADQKSFEIGYNKGFSMSAIQLELAKKDYVDVLAQQMQKNPAAIAIHNKNHQDFHSMAQNLFNSLASNEQGVLAHHIYNVGKGGAARYVGLNNAVIKYGLLGANQRNDIAKREVIQNFTYTYKNPSTGKTVENVAQEIQHQTAFFSVEALTDMLSKQKYPATMPAVLSNNNKIINNTDGTQSIDNTAFTQLKADLAQKGQDLQNDIVLPQDKISQLRNNVSKSKYAAPSAWY
jgi:hypothetical protein